MGLSVLTCCCALQPSLATLLSKPDKSMHDSIFASANGQTRRLRSYFPDSYDVDADIDNKVGFLSRCAGAPP